MFNQRTPPEPRRQRGEVERASFGFKYKMKILREARRLEPCIDRSLVVRVMIPGDHYYRHLRPRDGLECEGESLVGDAARIEQIPDDQQQIGLALVGDRDHAAERVTEAAPDQGAFRAASDAVAFEVHIGGMEQLERAHCFWRKSVLTQNRAADSDSTGSSRAQPY